MLVWSTPTVEGGKSRHDLPDDDGEAGVKSPTAARAMRDSDWQGRTASQTRTSMARYREARVLPAVWVGGAVESSDGGAPTPARRVFCRDWSNGGPGARSRVVATGFSQMTLSYRKETVRAMEGGRKRPQQLARYPTAGRSLYVALASSGGARPTPVGGNACLARHHFGYIPGQEEPAPEIRRAPLRSRHSQGRRA